MITKFGLHGPRPSPGFTLIELVIVLVILGIITALITRPIANFFSSWIDIAEMTEEEAEVHYILEQVSRDLRRRDETSPSEIDCEKYEKEYGKVKFKCEECDNLVCVEATHDDGHDETAKVLMRQLDM